MDEHHVGRPELIHYDANGEVVSINGMSVQDWDEEYQRLYGTPDHEDTYHRS